MLTNERIKQMRADARSDPRCEQELWYVLMARAVEAEATAPLLARIAELEADAKRYRWLRSTENAQRDEWNHFGPYSTPDDIDAVIDAAMKEQP